MEQCRVEYQLDTGVVVAAPRSLTVRAASGTDEEYLARTIGEEITAADYIVLEINAGVHRVIPTARIVYVDVIEVHQS